MTASVICATKFWQAKSQNFYNDNTTLIQCLSQKEHCADMTSL